MNILINFRRIVKILMDYGRDGCSIGNIFRSFLCVSVSLLLGFHVYTYLWGTQEAIEGDFGDMKYIVMQLAQGLSEIIYRQSFVNEQEDVECFHRPGVLPDLDIMDLWVVISHEDRSDMNREHERLRNELERMTSSLPAMASATGRVKDSLEPSRRISRASFHIGDYDRQIADYAMESAGARILDTGETQEYVIHDTSVGWVVYFASSFLCRECPGAAIILRPGTLPGECWAFKGFRGEATIRLVGSVQITGISVEHIPPHISPTKEISSAPRQFQLEGLVSRHDVYPHDFGTFEYDKEGKPIQYFEVEYQAPTGFHIVRFKVHSNWGHPLFTCVYRVRVHGDLIAGQAPQKTVNSDKANLH